MTMLDKLPAWARHLVMIVGAVFLGTVAETIIAGGGVSSVNWLDTLRQAVDLAAVAGASTMAVLYLTPLTRQYGTGAAPKGEGDLYEIFPDDDEDDAVK